jgi:tetratricopeptide (TPR) repeat protein
MTAAYSPSDLRRILHVTDAELRTYLRAASLPVFTVKQPQSYSFQHLVILRTAIGLGEAGISARRIRKVLASLQRQLGDSRSMSSVKVYASGTGVIVWDGTNRWQPDSGQFVLNFEAHASAKPARLKPRGQIGMSQRESALMWWNRGVELQEHSQEAAQRAYEEAVRLEPSLIEAHINLGRLYHDAGRLKEAEASYRRAIRYRPELATAYFNLGVVLEDRGRDSAAITAYEQALQRDPRLKPAHCHLGELYERHGRLTDALRHYAAAKRCGPGGGI